jgi:hypothetical protein
MDIFELVAATILNAVGPALYVYLTLTAIILGGLTVFIVMRLCGNYIMARLKTQILPGHRRTAIEAHPDGTGRFQSMPETAGYIESKYAQYRLGARSSTKTPDGDLYFCNSRSTITWPIEIAAMAGALEHLGYQTIEEALKKFDDDWFRSDNEAYNELIEDAKKRGVKEGDALQIAVKEIQKRGSQALLKLNILTPFTIPLSILSNYGASEWDPEMNKNITDRKVLESDLRNLKLQKRGFDLNTVVIVGFLCVVVIMAAAVAMNILPKTAQTVIQVTTTTIP